MQQEFEQIAQKAVAKFKGEIESQLSAWTASFSGEIVDTVRAHIIERINENNFTDGFGEISYDQYECPITDDTGFTYCLNHRGILWKGHMQTCDGPVWRIRYVDYDDPNRPRIHGTEQTPPFKVATWIPPSDPAGATEEYPIYLWDYSGVTILTNYFNIYYWPRLRNADVPSYKMQFPHILHLSDFRAPNDMIYTVKHYIEEASCRDPNGNSITYFRVTCARAPQSPIVWITALTNLHVYLRTYLIQFWPRATRPVTAVPAVPAAPEDVAALKAKLSIMSAELAVAKAEIAARSDAKNYMDALRGKLAAIAAKVNSI
jgi:hypothetical protein